MGVSRKNQKFLCLATVFTTVFSFSFSERSYALDKASFTPNMTSAPYLFHSDPSVKAFKIAAGSRGDTVKESSEMGSGAQNFIESMAQRALDFLGDPDMPMELKKTSFRKLLEESFDMNTIGRFSMGRYWRVSTKQQKQEYLTLFRERVIDVYSGRFSEYKGQKFETRGFRAEGTKDTIVHSFIVPDSGPEVQVDWRVRYKDGSYRVVDVIVEGVSMSVTQRSDFSSVIQRGGGNVEVLINHLRGQ
jgi:phospholipid transport system substrate-binding protein